MEPITQMANYLKWLTGDIFKLLPMKEEELAGADNHMTDYINNLFVNMKSASQMYPKLLEEKEWLYVINNIQYLISTETELTQWRRIVLMSTRQVNQLYLRYKEGNYDK